MGNWKQYKFEFNFLFDKKFRNHFYFFTCILPDYVGRDSSQNFEKILIFQNTTAAFLLFFVKPLVYFAFLFFNETVITKTQGLVVAIAIHHLQKTSSEAFQHHFKIYLLWFLHGKEYSFYTTLFCCTEMRLLFMSSSAISDENILPRILDKVLKLRP